LTRLGAGLDDRARVTAVSSAYALATAVESRIHRLPWLEAAGLTLDFAQAPSCAASDALAEAHLHAVVEDAVLADPRDYAPALDAAEEALSLLRPRLDAVQLTALESV
jgi:hypothetical protein